MSLHQSRSGLVLICLQFLLSNIKLYREHWALGIVGSTYQGNQQKLDCFIKQSFKTLFCKTAKIFTESGSNSLLCRKLVE